MKAKVLVIGDIHGALRALKQVLEKAQLSNGDSLIFMGDYVDGWPESAEVIDYLIALSKKFHTIFIKGNHDILCASWLLGNEADASWLENKEEPMIKSYLDIDAERRQLHLDFFSSLKDYFIDSENRLFIHAGFTSMKGPSEEFFSSNFNNDRTLLETALAMGSNGHLDPIFYPKRLRLFNEIYVGHTPTTKYGITTPIHAGNLWDMDTGATYHGRISAMDVNTKELWQSDLVESLY